MDAFFGNCPKYGRRTDVQRYSIIRPILDGRIKKKRKVTSTKHQAPRRQGVKIELQNIKQIVHTYFCDILDIKIS